MVVIQSLVTGLIAQIVASAGETVRAGDELTIVEAMKMTMGVLRLVETRGWDLAGGIVDDGEEDEARITLLEPGIVAGIHLEEHPLLRVALAAGAMAGASLLGPRRADALCAKEIGKGGAGEADALALGEELGQMGVVDTGVASSRQLVHLFPDDW